MRARLVTLLIVVAIAAISAPWWLYAVGLHGVKGRPLPPQGLASESVRLEVWAKARGIGKPEVQVLNPYTFGSMLMNNRASSPSVLVAWWVASDYLQEHQRYGGMGWWHLSGAALTIWLTRHWSTEQLLSAQKGSGRAG